MSEHYTLRCRECNREWGNRPSSICEDCLAPLEVKYDLDVARETFTADNIARRPSNLWRYAELLPIPEGYKPEIPVGMTPLVSASRLGAQLGSRRRRRPRAGPGFRLPDRQLLLHRQSRQCRRGPGGPPGLGRLDLYPRRS